MADFNFLPIQMQLFGGTDTQWEPLGRESEPKNYQQQMGYDLYNKAGGSDPFSNVFTGFNSDRFRTSILSDPRRMQQAEQLFTQVDSMQFKSMSPFDSMQNGWAYGGSPMGNGADMGFAALPAGGQWGIGYDTSANNPAVAAQQTAMSGFESQRQAALQGSMNAQRPSFPSNPNFDGINNASSGIPSGFASVGGSMPISFGNDSFDISRFPPEVQQQLLEQMGINPQSNPTKSMPSDPFASVHQAAVGRAMGSDSGSVTEATETISKLAKVMSEELIPASKDYTEQVTRTVSAMGGGSGGFGGGSSGGGVGFGGGNDDWWNGQARPEVMNGILAKQGYGKDFPNMNDGDSSYEDQGLGFNLNVRAPNFFRMRQGKSMFIQPMMNDMDQYMTQTAQQDLGMYQSGGMGYGDLMGGQYGKIRQREIAGQEFTYGLGKQVFNAYGGIADAAMGGDAANGILGAGLAIGAPAIGAGMIASSIGGMVGLGGPAGLLAAGATAAVGVASYASNASQDFMAVGRQQVNVQQQRASGDYNIKSIFDNFAGVVGDYAGWLKAESGIDSPEEKNRYEHASDAYKLAQQYSQGNISQKEIGAQLEGTGFNTGEILTGGNGMFYDDMAKKGIDRKQSGNMLSYWQRYNPGTTPQGKEAVDLEKFALAGVDMNSVTSSVAAATGKSTSDQASMSLIDSSTRWFLNSLPEGTNLELAQEQVNVTSGQLTSGNAARRRAGLAGFDPYQFQGDMYIQNPDLVDANNAYGQFSGNMALQDPTYYQNVVGPRAREKGYGEAGKSFNITDYYRDQNTQSRFQGIYDSAKLMGGNMDAVGAAMGNLQDMSVDDQNRIYAEAKGDRMVLSKNWEAMGDSRYRTLNTDTGLGIFDAEKRSLQDTSIDINRDLDTYQYNQQTSTRNIGYQTQTGGASGVNAQGYAVGGDGLAGLSSLFQAQGMNLQTGNGMGMWQVEDASTALSREQQQYRLDQGGATLGIAAQNRDLANRQYNESYAMNQQQFTMQTQYQSQNMDIGRSQDVTQTQWQNQDMSMDRNKMELQYGWQQEDYDRNIRFARGRQRVDLMREQERSAITHSMDETQQGNTEERAKTTQQWQTEEFNRKKEYFDESKTLAQQEMEMNKRHHDEKLALDNASFEITKQNHEKEKEWMVEEWGLQDQRRLLTRQNEELQYKTATELAEAGREAALQLDAISTQLKTIGRTEQDNEGFINVNTGNGNAFVGGVNAVKPTTPAPKPIAPAPKHVQGGGYEAGGYTGSGPSGGVAGVVHNNEYVVPEGGALVMHGGGGTEALAPYLIKMIAILEKGILNANIYTNVDSVNMKDVYAQAGTRFKK